MESKKCNMRRWLARHKGRGWEGVGGVVGERDGERKRNRGRGGKKKAWKGLAWRARTCINGTETVGDEEGVEEGEGK